MTQNDIILGLAMHYFLEEEDREQARSRPRRRVVRNGAFVNL